MLLFFFRFASHLGREASSSSGLTREHPTPDPAIVPKFGPHAGPLELAPLREAIERILVLCPAPLVPQWQDEMLRWFGEAFEPIDSARDKRSVVNPWGKESQIVYCVDYAKQENGRERVWQQPWDLVIVDEAQKCSAYTKRSSGRGDEVEKTRRYQLPERLAADADHLLLLTATPHHGDDDRFGHFVRLIDLDLFPGSTLVGDRAAEIRRDISQSRGRLPLGCVG